MRERKEDARPAVGAAERAKESKIDGSDSNFHFNANEKSAQPLSRLLPLGKENAIPGRDLVKILGLKDLRTLSKIVEHERRTGMPICASVTGERGYYLARDAEELSEYIKSLSRRVLSTRKTLVYLEDTLDFMMGQEHFE